MSLRGGFDECSNGNEFEATELVRKRYRRQEVNDCFGIDRNCFIAIVCCLVLTGILFLAVIAFVILLLSGVFALPAVAPLFVDQNGNLLPTHLNENGEVLVSLELNALNNNILGYSTTDDTTTLRRTVTDTEVIMGNTASLMRGYLDPNARVSLYVRGGDVEISNKLYVADAYIDNDLHLEGSLISSQQYTPSDPKLKHNIEPLYSEKQNIWHEFDKIHPISFQYKEDHDELIHFGFSAEEIQQVFPNLVSPFTSSHDGHEYLSVRVNEIIPLIFVAMKENKQKIESIEEKIREIQ